MRQFLASLLLIAVNVASAAPDSLTWSNADFQQQFLASYGFDGPREPKISPAEQQTLQALVPQLESGQYTLAANQLSNAMGPDSSAALDYTLANLYRQTGEVALAESAYRQALKKMPGFVRASRNLGLLLLQEGRFQDAMAPLGQALSRGSEDSTALGALAFCHFQMEDYAAAMHGYEKAAFLEPDNPDWQLGRVQCLIQLDRDEEALAMAERFLEAHPDYVEARRIAINACLAQQDWERAAAHLELLRRRNQADAAAMLLLGRTYLNLGLPQRAASAFRSTLDLQPRPSTEQMLSAAELLAQQGYFDETSSLLDVVYQQYGESLSGEAMNQLLRLQGRLKKHQGELAAASRLLTQATQRDPLDGEAWLLLGAIERDREHLVEAQIAFERATNLDGVDAKAWLELARLQVAQRRWDQAIDALQQAQAIRPEDRVANYLEAVKRVAEQQ